MRLPIYLDHNATTPVRPEVTEAVTRVLRDVPGNPSSGHWQGVEARRLVEQARREVAALVGADPDRILFTGCATEANNLAILGLARARQGRGRHLVTTAIEHPSVRGPMAALRREGWEVSVLPADGSGRVSVNDLAAVLREDTVLVSVMHANNETGVIQPVAALGALCRERGIPLHVDAAQSAGKIPVSVADLGAGLLSIAGHKFGAPKGVAALYVAPGLTLEPLCYGGGQEAGLRPGTENVAWAVGLGVAARLACRQMAATAVRVGALRDRLHRRLLAAVPDIALNGDERARLPGTLNVSFPGVEGRALLHAVAATVSASTGSACHGTGAEAGGVLAAMGLPASRVRGAVRLSLGPETTVAEVDVAADALAAAWRELVHRGEDVPRP